MEMSGRANAHTSEAAFRRPLEVNGGGSWLEELASASPGNGPKPPIEEVLPDGAPRFLFPESLADAVSVLDGWFGWGQGSRSGFSPGPRRITGCVPSGDRSQQLNSLMFVGRQEEGRFWG